MSTPTRRPIRYRPTLDRFSDDLARTAPEIELGWSVLLMELNDAGWPSRTPEGDQRPARQNLVGHCGICREPFATKDAYRVHIDDTGHNAFQETEAGGSISYSDPTGDAAATERYHEDRAELEDLRHTFERTLERMAKIADRYRPKRIEDPESGRTFMPEPACTAPGCTSAVEAYKTGNGIAYRGMQQVAGVWVLKPKEKPPLCTKHRKQASKPLGLAS